MARIEPPTAKEIYAELNVQPVVLGKQSEGDVIREINANVLPGVLRTVGMAIDQAAQPFDYPFGIDVLQEAYSTLTDEEIAEKADELKGAVADWIKFECVRRLLGRITFRPNAGAANPYEVRLQDARALSEESKALALAGVTFVSALTPSTQSEKPPEEPPPLVSQSVRIKLTS